MDIIPFVKSVEIRKIKKEVDLFWKLFIVKNVIRQ